MKISTKTLNLLLDCYDHARVTNKIEIKHKRDTVTNYKFLASLARGSYGDVFIVQHTMTSKIFALKRLNKDKIKKNPNTALYNNERNCMIETRNSKYLLSLHKAFQSRSHCYFLMDFVIGGDLLSLLAKLDILDESYIRFYTAELILALKELRSLGYLHRDIKPDNILITNTGHIKLGDFGSCIKTINGTVKSGVSVGTPDYISPEVLNSVNHENEYGYEVDVWSLGVVVYEMVNGKTPFYSHSLVETYRKITEVDYKHERGTESLKNLISAMVVRKEERATLDDLISHEYFKNTNFECLEAPYIPNKEWNINFTEFGFVDDDNENDCLYDGFVGFTYDEQVEIEDSCESEDKKIKNKSVDKEKCSDLIDSADSNEIGNKGSGVKKERFEICENVSKRQITAISDEENRSNEEKRVEIKSYDSVDEKLHKSNEDKIAENMCIDSADNEVRDVNDGMILQQSNDHENSACNDNALGYKVKEDSHQSNDHENSARNDSALDCKHKTKLANAKIVPECCESKVSMHDKFLEIRNRLDENCTTERENYKQAMHKLENLALKEKGSTVDKDECIDDVKVDKFTKEMCIKCEEREKKESTIIEACIKDKQKRALNKLLLNETRERLQMYTENIKSQYELITYYVDHLVIQNKYLKKEIRKKESKIDYENVKFMEELKKELRQKKMEIRELEQKVEEEVLMRQRLQDEVKYVKSQTVVKLPEVRREYVCKKVTVSDIESESTIHYQEVRVAIENGNLLIDKECESLNHVYADDLKSHEMYFVGEKKRKLMLKVVYIPNIDLSVGSSTKCEDELLLELKKEESILQGLTNLLKIVKGKVYDDAKLQQQGCLSRIEQINNEIKRNKSNTMISVEKTVRTKEFNNHRFVNKTFKETTICYHCNQILYGSFDQGYCCMDCNMVTHKSCYILINESCELHKAIKNGRMHYLMMRSIEEKEKILKIIKSN